MGANLKPSFYSPLRYPGGKGKLSHYIQLLFEYNSLNGGYYIEPFAGGASVALSLLFNEYVEKIYINDYDYRIYAFWYSILHYPDEFCKKIVDIEISISNWDRQREININPEKYSILDVGFSTFFLNRTNISGILKAGVIGGRKQTGRWKMNARFNKKDLILRINKINRFKNRISIFNLDAIDFVTMLTPILTNKSFIYFDPPYYNKGKELYINYYEHKDHVKISQLISNIKDAFWLISYDNNVHIRNLYKDYFQKVYNINYHASNATKGTELLIFSPKLVIPNIQNPLDKDEIKSLYL